MDLLQVSLISLQEIEQKKGEFFIIQYVLRIIERDFEASPMTLLIIGEHIAKMKMKFKMIIFAILVLRFLQKKCIRAERFRVGGGVDNPRKKF